MKKLKNIFLRYKFLARYSYLKYKFRKALKQDKGLCVITTDNDRAMGKSTILVELSEQYDMRVIVKTNQMKKLMQKKGCENVIQCNSLSNLRGMRLDSPVLVEEGFTVEEFIYIHNNFKAYGFVSDRVLKRGDIKC